MATEPKENRFVRFHALQGILLFGAHFICIVILRVLGAAVFVSTNVTGSGMAQLGGSGILLVLNLLVGLTFLTLYIIGMIKANQGQMWKLPVLGDIAEKNS